MFWRHRRDRAQEPTVDSSIAAAKINLEHVRIIANRAIAQAESAQAVIAALMQRTDPNG